MEDDVLPAQNDLTYLITRVKSSERQSELVKTWDRQQAQHGAVPSQQIQEYRDQHFYSSKKMKSDYNLTRFILIWVL